MVRLQDLRDDHYVFNREEFAVIGSKSHNVYRLGDEVDGESKECGFSEKASRLYDDWTS